MNRIATLQEIETWYGVDDVLDANQALDVKYEQEKKANERARAK